MAEKKGKARKSASKKRIVSTGENDCSEAASSEINAARWSVVSFEECAAKNLTYAEAAAELKHLAARKTAGLCIITDEAAARIENKNR